MFNIRTVFTTAATIVDQFTKLLKLSVKLATVVTSRQNSRQKQVL